MAKKKIKRPGRFAPLMIGEAELLVRLDAPASALADLNSGDIDRVLAGLGKIVREHPWVDDEDRPLTIGDMDLDLLAEIVAAYGAAINAPKA